MKKILFTLLFVPLTLIIGALTKHNFELNNYISNDTVDTQKIKTKYQIHTTEVHIVGTVHFETDSIKRHDLYNYINSIRPTVILYEGTAGPVRRIVKRTDYLLQLWYAFKKGTKMERAVVLKYLKNNPDCVLLPYEWELRDQYHRKHKLRKKSKKLINEIIQLSREKLLTETQSNTIQQFLKLNNTLIKMDQGATIADINKTSTDSLLKVRQSYIYEKIPEIGKVRKETSNYLNFISAHMSYWDIRNKAMVQNILKQIEANPNEIIVVLNGYYHRYYLIEELKKYEKAYKFSIKEM